LNEDAAWANEATIEGKKSNSEKQLRWHREFRRQKGGTFLLQRMRKLGPATERKKILYYSTGDTPGEKFLSRFKASYCLYRTWPGKRGSEGRDPSSGLLLGEREARNWWEIVLLNIE
jgi:hypothetical protein